MQSAGEAASGSRLPDHRPDHPRVNRNIEWRTMPHKHVHGSLSQGELFEDSWQWHAR